MLFNCLKTIKKALLGSKLVVLHNNIHSLRGRNTLKGKPDKGSLFRDTDKTRRVEKGGRQFFRFISFCTFHYFRYVWTSL